MNNSVIIKGNKHGITVVLDGSLSFEEVKEQVKEKFEMSSKFFGTADMALSFEGRDMTLAEQKELVNVISEASELNIICITSADETEDIVFEEAVKKALESTYSQTEALPQEAVNESTPNKEGQFYKGTLRSGQVLKTEGSVVVLGDVNPGGRIISTGNVIVLGNLKGNVFAGANGNEDCFVVALEMNPMQIKIGGVIARSSDADTQHKKKNKGLEPKIAYVEDGNIYIEELGAEVFADIRI